MRGLLVLAIGIVFFGYAVTRPPDQPASKPIAFAPIPSAPKPADSPKAVPRPETANMARASAPVEIAPRIETPLAAKAPPIPKPAVPKPNNTEVILTTAAIAALIVAASRQAYYASGRPCACPNDRMRNGRSCGSRSAYSRPGGASPLCFPSDVTAEMINSYRSRVAAR